MGRVIILPEDGRMGFYGDDNHNQKKGGGGIDKWKDEMLWSFCFPCFIFLLCILSLSEKPSSFTFLSFFLSHNAQVPSFNLYM